MQRAFKDILTLTPYILIKLKKCKGVGYENIVS